MFASTTIRAIIFFFVSCRCDCRCQHNRRFGAPTRWGSVWESKVRKCYLLTTPLHSLNSFSFIISFYDCHAIGFLCCRHGTAWKCIAIRAHLVRFNLNSACDALDTKYTHQFNININLNSFFPPPNFTRFPYRQQAKQKNRQTKNEEEELVTAFYRCTGSKK